MAGRSYRVQDVIKMANQVATVAAPLIEKYGPQAAELAKQYGPQIAEVAGNAARAVGSTAAMAGEAVANAAGSAAAAVGANVGGAASTGASSAGATSSSAAAGATAASSGASSAAGAGAVSAAASASSSSAAASPEVDPETERVILAAKQETLASCAYAHNAADFKKDYDAASAAGVQLPGHLAQPGCFVVLKMPNPYVKDLSRFEEVYVGSGMLLGEAVHEQLVGEGNPDVYADFKYRQALEILLYPCEEGQIRDLKLSLIVNLQAFASYNAREISASTLLEAGPQEE